MIQAARLRGLPPTTIAAALFISALLGVPSAHAGVTTIAWDPSPDPSVIGYRVHVGTTSGNYAETFDVGNTLTFSYEGVDGRSYYFAVAAYSPGPLVGPLSSEVSTASSVGDAPSYWSSLWAQKATASTGRATVATAGTVTSSAMGTAAHCWQSEFAECMRVQQLARVTERVSSLAATPDGRLVFVEGARRLRLMTATGLVVRPLVETKASSTQLNQVAVDPSFVETGFVWASETHRARRGARTFAVVRYRLTGNSLGERTVIVAGIALPAAGDAVFAVDAAKIYVAVPGSADPYHPHWGMVLRFNSDGSSPEDSINGPALLAAGYKLPSAIATDPSSTRVWLSGVEPEESGQWLNSAQAGSYTALAALPHDDHYDLLRIRSDGVLERSSAAHNSVLLSFDASAWGYPIAVAVGADGQIFLSLYSPSVFRPVTFVTLLPSR